jgi:hypothetical protein
VIGHRLFRLSQLPLSAISNISTADNNSACQTIDVGESSKSYAKNWPAKNQQTSVNVIQLLRERKYRLLERIPKAS